MSAPLTRDVFRELNLITQEYTLRQDAVDLYEKGDVLLDDIPKDRAPGGDLIKWPLEIAQVVGGSYGPNDTFDVTRKEIFDEAYCEWKDYYGMGVILERQVKQTAGNHNKYKRVRLVEGQLASAEKKIRNDLANSLWSSMLGNSAFSAANDSSTDIYGLGDLFYSSATTEYQGLTPSTTNLIDENSVYMWMPKIITLSTVTSIAMAYVHRMRAYAALDDDRKSMPDVVYMHPYLFNQMIAELNPYQIYTGGEKANFGFDQIAIGGGCTLKSAWRCPATVTSGTQVVSTGIMVAVNTNYLVLVAHSDDEFMRHEWQKAWNQPKAICRTTWMGNLVVTNRRAHCMLTAVKNF
jgi:hypothetical protein